MLSRGVLADKLAEFVNQVAPQGDHPFVICRCEHDTEIVGNQDPIPRHHGGFRVQFAAKSASNFDRLDATFEGLRESTIHGALKTALKAVE